MKRLSVLGVTFLACSLGACAVIHRTPAPGAGGLTIQQSSVTAFDATYRRGDAWARARVAYSPTSTFYEITTSTGTVVVRTGTALDATRDAPPADPRRQDEVVRLSAADPEYPLVAGLLDGLLAAGASPTPTAAETGSTLYAAAYFAAKALGRTPPPTPPDAAVRPAPSGLWPYPGYYDYAQMPAELVASVGGEQNGPGNHSCCGPYTCVDGDWNPTFSCDDWCAAGDMCNAHNWGNCGTAMYCPGGGCNCCPHSDSSGIRGSSYHGCNNGTCSPKCWEPTPTHYGPASNYDYYGNVYFGSKGGEYGSGGDDYCGQGGGWWNCFGTMKCCIGGCFGLCN
ncbi:MAG TPA: hypothetical protein VKW76_08245 [Candidatus Binatia bacterium]|nr:hypothetical protein [Candidatus Binatia bacterium]